MGNGHSEVISSLLQPSPSNPFNNWLSADVALQLETYTKFDLATHHFSRFIRQHPYWSYAHRATTEAKSYPNNNGVHEFGKLRERFSSSLFLDLEFTEQKFHLHDAPLLSRVGLFSVNDFPLLHHFLLWSISNIIFFYSGMIFSDVTLVLQSWSPICWI